jgi:hypothetical protein
VLTINKNGVFGPMVFSVAVLSTTVLVLNTVVLVLEKGMFSSVKHRPSA